MTAPAGSAYLAPMTGYLRLTRLIVALAAPLAVAPVVAAPAAAQEAERVETAPGRVTGRPTPRFESLRNAETNLRVGPSENYKILWVYHRRGMPVRVIDEYDVWRRVEDSQGDSGWLHHAQISPARTGLTLEETEIRAEPAADSKLVARVGPTVALHLLECRVEICRVEVDGLMGWTPKAPLWGVGAAEVF